MRKQGMKEIVESYEATHTLYNAGLIDENKRGELLENILEMVIEDFNAELVIEEA